MLTGEQFEEFRRALESAFPSIDALKELMQYEFTINLNTIWEGKNLPEVVNALIGWFDERNQIEELLTKALDQQPDAKELLAFEQQLARAKAEATIEPQSEILNQLADEYGVQPLSKGARRIRVRSRRLFGEIFREYAIFGGRQKEWAQLNRFVEQEQSGYFFVTGPTGYGKTALLANWLQSLAGPIHVVYHFVSRQINATENFCYQSLCEQLMAFHKLGGELPQEGVYLRRLYAALLKFPPPSGRRLVVILDGLDDGLEPWAPNKEMFPHELPRGTQVIFSAGAIADKDWLADLDLDLPEDRVVSLSTLDLVEVKDVVSRSALFAAAESALDLAARRLNELSKGDPFYVKELLRQLKNPGGNLQTLERPPVGLDNYLREWWKESGRQGLQEAFTDLMGILALARAPLSRQELIELSPEDAIRGDNFDLLIDRAAKYVMGAEDTGYQLSNKRIREFVLNRLCDSMNHYRSVMAHYSLRWSQRDLPPHARAYILQNAPFHLVDARCWSELVKLLNAEWMACKWNHFGSYASFVQDVGLAATAALKQGQPDYASLAAFAVARQTAREIMQAIPTELLIAWIKLGEVKRVLALLEARTDKGGAVSPMTAVAAELVAIRKTGESNLDQTRYADIAADLLAGAAGMLNLIRTAYGQLDVLPKITALLVPQVGLPEHKRLAILEQCQVFALGLREPALRAATLGIVAEVMVNYDQVQAQALLGHIDDVLDKIEHLPDRNFVIAHMLPALTALDPSAARTRIHTLLDASATLHLGSSSLSIRPVLETLIVRWPLEKESDKRELVEMLTKIGEQSIAERNVVALQAVVSKLCRHGYADSAVGLVDRFWGEDKVKAAEVAFGAIRDLYASNPRKVQSWLNEACHFTNALMNDYFAGWLATSLALIGEWQYAFEVLASVHRAFTVDLLCDWLRLLGESESVDLPQTERFVDAMVQLTNSENAEKRAKVNAVAGQSLIPHDLDTAQRYMNYAASLCLARLPAGDTGELRPLLALSFHQDGDFSGATHVVQGMKQGDDQIKTMNRLLQTTSSSGSQIVSEYMGDMVRMLQPLEGHPTFPEALMQAVEAVGFTSKFIAGTTVKRPFVDHALDRAVQPLRRIFRLRNTQSSERISTAAQRLCDYIFETVDRLPAYDDRMRCSAGEAAARTRLNPARGWVHFERVLSLAGQWLEEKRDVSLVGVESVCRYLGQLHLSMSTEIRERLRDFHSLAVKSFPTRDNRVGFECSYALVVAEFDPEWATSLIEAQLDVIDRPSETTSHLVNIWSPILRILADLEGGRTGRQVFQAFNAKNIAEALVSVGAYASDRAIEITLELIDRIATMTSSEDRALALAWLFRAWASAPNDLRQRLTDVYQHALDQATVLSDPELYTAVLKEVVGAFCSCGDLIQAEHVKDLILDTASKSEAENTISAARAQMQIKPSTPLEIATIRSRDDGLGYTVVQRVREADGAKDVLMDLCNRLASDQVQPARWHLLKDWIPLMALPAHEIGGTQLVASIVDTIEEMDRRFLQAADLIAKPRW